MVIPSLVAALTVSASALVPQTDVWRTAPPLPFPVSNNAVVGLDTDDGPAVFSFLGIGTSKRWDGLLSSALRWTVDDDGWTEITPVPGPGRLAATAQAVGGRIYVFGGYTVAADGAERSVPQVDVYDLAADSWTLASPMPVPVDDAVSGVWRDSLVVVVSGWHDSANVALVQLYDPAADSWRHATPIPGPPVFGHVGGVAGDAIVYLGGARVVDTVPRFRLEPSAWRGDIDPADPTRIAWRRLPDPPGPWTYRAAGAGADGRVLFAGGTENPYNYDGIGYDGVPAAPLANVLAYDVDRAIWQTLAPLAVPSMDHRSLAVVGGRIVLAGGMTAGQQVSRRVQMARLDSLGTGR